MKKIINIKVLSMWIVFIFLFISNSYQQPSGWTLIPTGTILNIKSAYFFDQNTGIIVGGKNYYPYWKTLMMRTTDGGFSWTQYFSTLQPPFMSIFFPGNGQVGFALGGYPGCIISRSTDRGTYWSLIYNQFNFCIQSSCWINTNTGYAVGDWGNIIKTTNSGMSWEQLYSCTSDYLLSVVFADSLTGYAAGSVGQIIKTTNAGYGWFYLINASSWKWYISFLNKDTGFTAGKNGSILRTLNGGNTWNSINPNIYPVPTYMYVNFFDINTGYATGSEGLIIKTTNGGLNWTKQTTNIIDTISSIFWIDNMKGYATACNGKLLFTNSGGDTITTYIPTLIYPPNGAVNISLTPGLTWSAGVNIPSYKVQISTLSNFQAIIDSVTTNYNQYIVPAGKLNGLSTYFWRVCGISSTLGQLPWSEVWYFGTTTSINQFGTEIPEKYFLYNNFPNPFNSTTHFKLDIPEVANTKITLYDISGKEIEILFNGQLTPGRYELSFDAKNLTSGVYFYRIESQKFKSTRRMVIVK